MTKTRILMLDGDENLSLNVGRSLAQENDVELHVISANTWPSLRVSRHCRSFHIQPPLDDAQRLDFVRDVIERTGCNVLLGVRDDAVAFMSAHQEQLRSLIALSPVPPLSALQTAQNKWEMAEFAMRHNLPIPETRFASADSVESCADLPFPVLLKPIIGCNGEGIEFFQSRSALETRLRQPLNGQSIVQGFVDGYDVDCSVLCDEGRIVAFTIQRGFLRRANRYAAPAGVEFIDDEQVYAVAERFMSAFRWNGVAHLDMRFDEDARDVKLIEINGRYWESIMGSVKMGVNFPYLAARMALGDTISPLRYRNGRYVNLKAFVQEKTGQRVNGHVQMSLSDTAIKSVLVDPLPDVVKLVRYLFL